jgi:fatty-acyl-CoA synthase
VLILGVPVESFVEQAGRRRSDLEARHRPWRPQTLPGLLDAVAAQFPDRPFVIGEEETLSYAGLADRSARLARGLIARGVQAGERVALVMPNGPDMIAARFAVARAGAVAVPVSFRLHAAELAQVLRQSEASALITMEEFREINALEGLDQIAPGWERLSPAAASHPGAGQPSASQPGAEGLPALRLVVTVPGGAEPARPGLLTLDALATGPDAALDGELAARAAAAGAQDVTTIFYTSGTTGLPKGVLSTHDMELRSAYGSAYARAFEDGRRIMFALPLNHVFAYVEGLLASMFVAGSVVVQSVFDPGGSLAAIARHQVGEALFVPTMSLAVVAAARRSGHDLSSLHSVMSAASSAPASLWRDLQDVLGAGQLVTAYGMSETSAATTFTRVGGPVEDLEHTVGWPKAGGAAGDPGLGGALAEYKAVDQVTGEDLPRGQAGELAARGPIVCRGYFRQPEATAAATLPDGWLRSGDLGYLREDGALVLTGRAKEVYKCGGELVMPTEVEAVLTGRPDVAQAYVVGVPDARMGEVGCAWVVPAEDAKLDPEEVISFCRAELARFKVPQYVMVTTAAELPLTVSGKVQKFRLAERAAAALA